MIHLSLKHLKFSPQNWQHFRDPITLYSLYPYSMQHVAQCLRMKNTKLSSLYVIEYAHQNDQLTLFVPSLDNRFLS